MTYNAGAFIAPVVAYLNPRLIALAPDADLDTTDYDRVQLLTREEWRKLIFNAWVPGQVKWGELGPDFPICSDIGLMAQGAVRLYEAKIGLAVRSATMRLVYSRTRGVPHEILIGALADGTFDYCEPQSNTFMDTPDLLKTMDAFRL